jgi:hypothetical protein
VRAQIFMRANLLAMLASLAPKNRGGGGKKALKKGPGGGGGGGGARPPPPPPPLAHVYPVPKQIGCSTEGTGVHFFGISLPKSPRDETYTGFVHGLQIDLDSDFLK